MPLSEGTKKIIIWSSVLLVSVGLITGLLIFFLKKSTPNQNQVTVNVSIIFPGNITKTASVQYDKTILSNKLVGEFIGSVLNKTKSKTNIPSTSSIFWNSMSLNTKTVEIGSDGQMTDKSFRQTLKSLIGDIPSKILFSANFKNSCPEGERPVGDPCKGQTGACRSTGWALVDHKFCPSGQALYNCCKDDPKGPYATCSDGVVSCGQCPDPKRDCGDAGCGLIGNVCTATGWICASGVSCPIGDSLSKCCTGVGQYASCKEDSGEAKITCSDCPDADPPCPADCDMSGIFCGPDGKKKCMKGMACPPDKVAQTCCPDDKVAVCGPSNTKVECKDCSIYPKPTSDPNYQKCEDGSCEGHAWVCTKNGWVCKPGQKCPQNPKFDYSTCCPISRGPNIPYCDTESNCVKCACPAGSTGCTNLSCGMPSGSCQTTCCPLGNPCNKDSSGNCACCPKEQICTLKSGEIKCCPDNTICTNGECLPVCGKDSAGLGITCTASQSCLEVDGLTADNIGKLKKEYGDNVRINGTSAFVCMNNKGCNFGNEVAVPSAQANYYPCYSFPDFHDPDEPGPGYCTEKDGNTTGKCAQNYTTSKSCNSDNACTWRNVLKYMSSDKEPKNPANQIEKEMQVVQNAHLGYFCDPSKGTTPFSRVVAYTTDNGSCSWDDCWTRMAQPGVIDVEYNTTNGLCVALQSCNDPMVGMTSGVLNKDGGKDPNPNTAKLPWNQPDTNSGFPDCVQKDTVCPITVSDFACVGSCKNCSSPNQFIYDGQVVNKKYGCNPYDNYKCALDGVGPYGDLDTCINDDKNTCCPAGMTRYKNACYNYNPPISTTDPGQCGSPLTGNIACSGTKSNNKYSTFRRCCDARASCVETTATPVPYGTTYCQGNTHLDTWCGGRRSDGKWVSCNDPSGCSIKNVDDSTGNKVSWAWNEGLPCPSGFDCPPGPHFSYCSWPPS